MSETVLEVTWPTGEPLGTMCEFGNPMLASEGFLRSWQGADTPNYVDLMIRKTRGWCDTIVQGETSACLLGDVPGSYFVGVGQSARAPLIFHGPALALLKWLGAPEDFGLPVDCKLRSEYFGRCLSDFSWVTENAEYYLCCSNDPGDIVLAQRQAPICRFKSGIARIEVFELKLPGSGGNYGYFELYVFSRTFVQCRWSPPTENSDGFCGDT